MSATGERTITLRRPDNCVVCQRDLCRGERAVWDPACRTARCLACPAANSTPVDPGVAGASAMKKYEVLHAAREQHARSALGKAGVLIARVTGDPASTRVWKQGAEGEMRTAVRLEKLLKDTEVMLLHDRRIPGHGRANIDHLAVGPGGVTVIDTKTFRGKISVQTVGGLFSSRRQELRIGGRNRNSLVESVKRQAGYVQDALAGGQLAGITICCALCFSDPKGMPLLRRLEVDGVVIDGPRRVAALARRDGPAGSADIERLWRKLAERFPTAR